jgi:hypothetical protein
MILLWLQMKSVTQERAHWIDCFHSSLLRFQWHSSLFCCNFSQWGVKRLMGLQQANPMESSSSSYCKIDRLNLSPNFRVETAKSTGWRHQLERLQSLGLGAGYCGFAKLQEDAQTSADFQIYPAATPRLEHNWNASLSQTARAIGSLDLPQCTHHHYHHKMVLNKLAQDAVAAISLN